MNQFTPQIPLTKVSGVLLNAMALLESPNRWTKDVSARDAKSKSVAPSNETACKFCMIGAISRFGDKTKSVHIHNQAQRTVLNVVYDDTAYHTVPAFNDSGMTKHERMLQVMTAAAFYALADEA